MSSLPGGLSTIQNFQPSTKLPPLLTVPVFLLLAALLRFYNLSGQSLWADEGNSVALARRSFVEIARRTTFDIHPPLYYWLLKVWITVLGDSETGLRSLSVVLGLGLVYLIWVLGTRLFNPRVGLVAAFIAAISPFQIYYSQEARMYMLLAFLGSLTILLALLILNAPEGRGRIPVKFFYVLTVTAGLYTHYAYPLILVVVNLAGLAWFIHNLRQLTTFGSSKFLNWLVLQFIPLLLFLPWLPIAWRQVTTWPSERQAGSLRAVLETISSTLFFGLSWPYDLGLMAALSLGLILLATWWFGFGFRGNHLDSSGALTLIILCLWLLLPVVLTIFVFSPAFLKFLLVAAPAVALLLAFVIERLSLVLSQRQLIGYLIGGALSTVLASASALSLYYYYTDPAYARDNYRGIAQFIKAVGGPDDAVILNAEGQQDVFNYYYERSLAPEAPVYPLPRHRPLDEMATLAELQAISHGVDQIYAVYWAAHQADPEGLIEGWLDGHLFKATDQWYGNVRLVSYSSPQFRTGLTTIPVDYQLGQDIRLTGYALSAPRIAPGDILQVALQWETDRPLVEDYTVFVQILDQANHLVGQRDASPLLPTPGWPVTEPVPDAQGIFVEPGTPPGKHRLIVGLYNSKTGQRLPIIKEGVSSEAQGRDFIELAELEIIRSSVPLPFEAFKIQVPMNVSILDLSLWGYDLYKLGHRSTPDVPLHPGDPIHLVTYWAPTQPVQQLADRLSIRVVTEDGRDTPVSVTYQLAGTDYPVGEWRAGEIVRAQYDFFLDGLEPGNYRLALALEVSGDSTQQVVTLPGPFQVE